MRVLKCDDILPGIQCSVSDTSGEVGGTTNALLEFNVGHQVLSALDAFSEKNITCCSYSYNVRMLAERFERNGIVNLSSGLPRIVQGDQVRGS